MKNVTKSIIAGLALFSLFFGAGDLILPPYLGFNAGEDWWIVAAGFLLSGVLIPMFAVMAYGRVQGTMYDFARPVSHWFARIYCVIVYAISASLPAPRTAAVTHEMAIQPYIETSSLTTSAIYFLLVLVFTLNRSKIISIVGRYLTPIIVILLLSIIVIAAFSDGQAQPLDIYLQPLREGILEGYQTYGAIGGIVVGAILVISLKLVGDTDPVQNRILIRRAALVTGLGLAVIYVGLIWSGSILGSNFNSDITRTALLTGMAEITLGNAGNTVLSLLVALACFTTAVGIVTGVSDYFKGLFNESQRVYTVAVILCCIAGVAIGQMNVGYIIAVAVPALMFIYPITIILILLNNIPQKFIDPGAYKWIIGVTFIFSIPDFLASWGYAQNIDWVIALMPLGEMSLGWLLPAIITTGIMLNWSGRQKAVQ